MALLLIVLWPGPAQGRRVVRRWGVAHPDLDEVAAGLTHLRRRRLWYPVIFVATGSAAAVLPAGMWDDFGPPC